DTAAQRSRHFGESRQTNGSLADRREVVVDDLVQILRLHLHRQVVIDAVVVDLQQEGARGAATHLAVCFPIVLVDQVIHRGGIERAADPGGGKLEEPSEFVFVGVGHENFVRDTPQKRLVTQLLRRVQVGRENDELVERYLDFLARRQGQIVVPLLQRN